MCPKRNGNNRIKSRLHVRLVIRGSDYEFSTEAPASQLAKELDELDKLNKVISKTLRRGLPASVTVSADDVFDVSPSIKASRKTIDNIESLFNTDWAKTPRTVADVIKALEANAVPDTTAAVSIYLTRLVQRGILRRVRKAGKYQYYKKPS